MYRSGWEENVNGVESDNCIRLFINKRNRNEKVQGSLRLPISHHLKEISDAYFEPHLLLC